jgi:anti-anti-sigma factor
MTSRELQNLGSPIALPELTELVRGNEQQLLALVQPLVRRQDVLLDFEGIKRIDAAGLASLITLYCSARRAGHRFVVANPSPHVREILALVGLEAMLVSHDASDESYCSQQLRQNAA